MGHMLDTCLQVGSTGVTMRSQKEITLKDDLGAKDRLDIYRNFLLYCMSGDVVALPMGPPVRFATLSTVHTGNSVKTRETGP